MEYAQPLNKLLKDLHVLVKQADTATRTELESDADMRQLLVQIAQREPFASQHDGEEGIFEFLKGLNDLVRLCFTLTKSGVEANFPFDAYSNVDAMPVIEVEFSHLKGLQATQGRLTLLDTPGPNEDGQTHLHEMLEEQLKKASAVLAVLDYTQLKSDADAQVRANLKEIAGTAKDRMYALVNKFDQKDRNSDDALTVKKYVAQTLMEGQVNEDSVFPVSSKQGYLASRARNEIERHGKLNLQEAWAKDFAAEALGPLWEEFAQGASSLPRGADVLWEKSGFVEPLNQVIVKAHRNAAFEALRSATSKLSEMAKNAEDFFKARKGALLEDIEPLQKKIDKLQHNIDSINQVEAEADASLQKAVADMKRGVHAETEAVQEKIQRTWQQYLQEGKSLEAAMAEEAKKAAEAELEQKRGPKGRKPAKKEAGIEMSKRPSTAGKHRIEGAEGNKITFNKKEKAEHFRGEIEKSIRYLLEAAEGNFQSCIENSIAEFNQDFDRQCKESVEEIKKSAQKNVDEFDIEIRLLKPKTISLDTSVAGILKNSVAEKTKKVTRSRRKEGVWGTVCGWFGTDDWGWENYQDTENYYEIDLNLILKSSNQGVKTLFQSADTALNQKVYPDLHATVDKFFKDFREKIEHIRGDLMKGIEDHRLDEDSKNAILAHFEQMACEAANLGKDCQTLDQNAEALFRRGEVMA